MYGLDYSSGMPDMRLMLNAGVRFVCRYVGYTSPPLSQAKILTEQEAQTLSVNGIAVVSNFEWYASRPSEGLLAGDADAKTAVSIHNSCGGPEDAPIYFSVDYNSTGEDVADYFRGVAGVIGLARVGAYGGYECIKYLFDNALITYGWQTYAWSSGDWDERADIRQVNNGAFIGTVEVDEDQSMIPYFGQWYSRSSNVTGNNAKLKQWTDVWVQANGETPGGQPWSAFKSGIFNVMWQAHNVGKVGLTMPATPEVSTVDWNNHPVLCQLMVNGFYCTWDNGVGSVYNNLDQIVFQGTQVNIQ